MTKHILWLTCCLFGLMLACKNKTEPSEGGTFSQHADNIESESSLPKACEKDLKKFGKFLDDYKDFMERHKDGSDITDAEEEEIERKGKELSMEFANSAAAYTDPECALAIGKMQQEFAQVMMQMFMPNN